MVDTASAVSDILKDYPGFSGQNFVPACDPQIVQYNMWAHQVKQGSLGTLSENSCFDGFRQYMI